MEHEELASGLTVHPVLRRFVLEEALPGTGIAPQDFWAGLAAIVEDLGPRNAQLLRERERLQAAIDEWHRSHPEGPNGDPGYQAFLREIGYLMEEPEPFTIRTTGVDVDVAERAGPQLVVPVSNARYALNAANARWGSLYDALYGTDALGDTPPPGPYDPQRGDRVIAWARAFLDDVVPLRRGSHADASRYAVEEGELVVQLADGSRSELAGLSAFVGHRGEAASPAAVLLCHHGLHVELVIDRTHPVGADDPAGVADVVLESAVTVIMDCEDSVAAVDVHDKVAVYRNWLGLMRGDLEVDLASDAGTTQRRLAEDRSYTGRDAELVLPGRAVMLVRNVGLFMTTDALRDGAGRAVPEGILDAVMTVLAAMHDLRKERPGNSRTAAVYVVKPKLHGPDEVAFTDELFTRVEALLGLPAGTVKIGLMDEERRTSVNLAACIRALGDRVAFINTGFLDRTGDEIHTSMAAGPVVPKAAMKAEPWLGAYEDRNVAIGLACGFRGRAQIGKGMWPAPDRMAAMLEEKVAHPQAGASCAWVPSPTAATLHATHYHRVDVAARQVELAGRSAPSLDVLLTVPLVDPLSIDPETRRREVENNAQGILGYVVRWVDQGVGCSKVPDIDDVALMEDRATCRISSQHLANWLLHGVVTEDEVLDALRAMAVVVDDAERRRPRIRRYGPRFDGVAFAAARELVLRGAEQPSGYTEPILHAHRLLAKARPAQTPV